MTRARYLPLAALLLFAGAGCRSAPAPESAAATTAAKTALAISDEDAGAAGIDVAAARLVERHDAITAPGVVAFDERRTARLGSLVDGVVARMRVQPGDPVRAGAVVATLHSHVVHDAWADYFKALAGATRAEADLAFARAAEGRAAALVADKALSPQEHERAKADVQAATQAVAAARADVTRTEQELHHYGVEARPDADPRQQEDIPIVAPFAGTVVERLVTEQTAVTPGTALLVVSDLSRVWVTAEIDETLVGRIAAGRPVTMTTAAYPGETFAGTLASVGDVVDATTRRIRLRIEVPNADRRLKPAMFVTVSIGGAGARRVVAVPAAAVQAMDGETVVFVRTADGRFTRRAVGVGGEAEGLVEITRGLADGDVVATAGAFLVKSSLTATTGEPD